MRSDHRPPNQLRDTKLTPDYLDHPEGSVFIEAGRTRVICTASVEDRVPQFLRNSGKGWVTAEYGMLPRATHTRMQRESTAGKVGELVASHVIARPHEDLGKIFFGDVNAVKK